MQSLEAQLVAGIRGIGDQLTKEDFLVRVQGMGNQVRTWATSASNLRVSVAAVMVGRLHRINADLLMGMSGWFSTVCCGHVGHRQGNSADPLVKAGAILPTCCFGGALNERVGMLVGQSTQAEKSKTIRPPCGGRIATRSTDATQCSKTGMPYSCGLPAAPRSSRIRAALPCRPRR